MKVYTYQHLNRNYFINSMEYSSPSEAKIPSVSHEI